MTVNKITNAPTQNEIINSINDLIDNKQDTISDLSTIRSNAANGQSAYTTIGGYGDIVTYNASNFVQKNGDSSTQTISLTSGTGTTALGIKSMATSSYLSLSGSSGWLGSYGVSSSKRAVFYNGTGYTLAYTSEIPTNTSDLTNDSGYITGINSSDVITALGYTPYNSTNPNGYTSNVGTVTSVNNTQPDASGDVTLTIPTVNDGVLTITQNGTSKGTFSANQSTNNTIALTDTTYSNFTGADGTNAGSSGLVPAPSATDNDKYLKGDGTWASVSGGSSTDVQINGTSITSGGVANILTNSAYNSSSNKIATMSDIQTYTNGTGISIGAGNTINHTNSITAGTAGTSSATSGSTLAVPYVTYDAQGHITSKGTHTHTVTGFLTSSSSYVASSRFDGQWVFNYQVLSTATAKSSTTMSLSSYLPSDSSTYDYEVMIYADAHASSNIAVSVGTVSSPIDNNCFKMSGYIRSNATEWAGYGIFPISHSNRNIYSQRGAAVSSMNVVLLGYRRIGTNT